MTGIGDHLLKGGRLIGLRLWNRLLEGRDHSHHPTARMHHKRATWRSTHRLKTLAGFWIF